MKITFVYAGHPHNRSLQSPYSITRELYKYLSARAQTSYHDWCTMGLPNVTPDTILIGHPNYDPNTIVQKAFRHAKCRAKCLIFPLHHGIPEHNLLFDDLVGIADKVFNVMGPYWYDTLEGSPFAHWKPKITRLDMAVDASQFPFLRERFNPPGRRNLVYVGNGRPEKNVEYLHQIIERFPQLTLHCYGYGGPPAPNVVYHGWLDLTPDVAAGIVRDGDIFVSPSRSDANPTTLLEASAWGLIPVCTPQSGYWGNDMFDQIPLDDVDGAVAVIERLQLVPEEDLLARARATRAAIESHYNWDRFCETVWRGLMELS